jgi:hypothetical protein
VADLLKDDDLAEIRRKITAGLTDFKKYEPLLHECLALASGKQWVRWEGKVARRLVTEPVKPGIDRYTQDELVQYRQTVHGELSLDDDRPQLLFRNEDLPDEDFAEQANNAVGYGWDYEFEANKALSLVRRFIIDMGTAAIRCRFDKTKGPVKANVPHIQGQPEYDVSAVLDAIDQGVRPTFKDIHEGRIRWEAGTPFNLVVPPGIAHEDDFPWECWRDAVYLPTLKEHFQGVLDDVKPDSIAPLTSIQPDDDNRDGTQSRTKLDDHAWLYAFYERPTPKIPDGRIVWLVGEHMKPVQVDPQLGYVGPDGTRRSGIHYFHYVRLSDRFWSRSMVELGAQPARAYSKRRTQIGAIFDRGQPKVIVEEGALKQSPRGYPVEVLTLKPGKPQPTPWPGIAPNQAMYQELETLRSDLERAIGLRVSLGENPPGVQTYAQLATLRETETRKLDTVIQDARAVIAHLVEDSVYDIGRYWGREKQVAVSDDDGGLKAFLFDATNLTKVYYRVEAAKGSAKPRTQGARLQLIQDIFNAAVNTGLVQTAPQAWVSWFKESNDQGQPIEIPNQPPHYQTIFAEYAKSILGQGELPPMLDYIDPNVLIPSVREIQTEATLGGNDRVAQACDAYLQVLVAAQQAKMAQAAIDQAPQVAANNVAAQQVPAQLAALANAAGGTPPSPGPGGLGGPPQNGSTPNPQGP